MSSLTSIENALEQMLAQTSALKGEIAVPIEAALGRILARDLIAREALPPFDNSAMDGYAVHTDSLARMPLQISQRITAGQSPEPLAPATAARIFTGAMIPPGANAVVMQEKAVVEGQSVRFTDSVAPQQNIRPRGNDVEAGSILLSAGTRMRPQELGLAASAGLATVPLKPRLRVAFASTGDELVEPGSPLSPGRIYNTNRYSLHGYLEGLGCEIIDGGLIPDQPQPTLETLASLAERADLVITSGGVSVGEADYVKTAIEQLGALSLWRVAVKPGKPVAFGRIGSTPFLGLPGNPSAVLLTFLLFGAPLIRHQQGQRFKAAPLGQQARADFEVSRSSVRREFMRARVVPGPEGQLRVQAHANQSSGALSAACWADGLAVVPENTTIARGDRVQFLSFTELLYGR